MPEVERIVRELLESFLRVPTVSPVIFFGIAVIGKVIVRSESLSDSRKWRRSAYVILTNGSHVCLVALTIVLATVLARTSNQEYREAVYLLLLALGLLVVYFLVCWAECMHNDPCKRNYKFARLNKKVYLGLYLPNAVGAIMVWLAVMLSY